MRSKILEFFKSYSNRDFETALRLLEGMELTDKQIAQISTVLDIQGQDGVWDADSYNCGLYNGLEVIKSIIFECDPEFKKLVEESKETSNFDVEVFEVAEKLMKESEDPKEKRTYTIEGEPEYLDAIEVMFDFMDYCGGAGHSTEFEIMVDGDGSFRCRFEKVDGKFCAESKLVKRSGKDHDGDIETVNLG